MAVNINIGADASAVQSSLNQIRDAIKRVGQEARALKDVDLSHPELRGMAEDVAKLQRAFENLKRVRNSPTAEAIRSGGYTDFVDWQNRHGTQFPEAARRQRHAQNVNDYLNDPNNQGDSGSGGGGAAVGRIGSIFEKFSSKFDAWHRDFATAHPNINAAGSGLVRGGAMAASLAGIPMIGGLLSQAVHAAQDDLIGTDTLMRSIRDTDTGFDKLNAMVHKVADGLGLTHVEAQHLASTWARLGNDTTAQSIEDHMKLSAGLARGYGVDPGAMAAGMARAQFMGMEPGKFIENLGRTIETGKLTGHTEEVMSALLHWTEQSSRTLVTGNTTAEFAAAFAALNSSGNAGFRGGAAADILGTVNGNLARGGGGGEASQILSFQAMSRHGVSNLYDQQYLREGGMFAALPDGSNMFSATREELRRRFGIDNETDQKSPKYRQYLANLSAHLGINMHQAEGLDNTQMSYSGASGRLIRDSGVDMSKLNATGARDFFSVLGLDSAGLDARKQSYLDRKDVSAEDKAGLDKLAGDPLKIALMRLAGKYGMEDTEGSRTRSAAAAFENATAELGKPLLLLTNELKELATGGIKGLIASLDGMKSGVDALRSLFEPFKGGGGAPDVTVDHGGNVSPTSVPGRGPIGGTFQNASLRVQTNVPRMTRPTDISPGSPEDDDQSGAPRLDNRSLPASIRTNNPGAIMPTPRVFGGEQQVDHQGKLGVYGTKLSGARALVGLLTRYQEQYGRDTIWKIISKWAPTDDGNDPLSYSNNVASKLGIGIHDKIDVHNPETMRALANEIATVESGRRQHGYSGSIDAAVRQMLTRPGGGTALPADDPSRIAVPPGAGHIGGSLNVYHWDRDGTEFRGLETVPLHPGQPAPVGGGQQGPNFPGVGGMAI